VSTNFFFLEKAQERPIIFIAHSLGGIVVKKVSVPPMLRSSSIIYSVRLSS